MKQKMLAAALLSALLLTACSGDPAESVPQERTKAESLAAESSANADESAGHIAESAVEAEPASEKKTDYADGIATPLEGVKLGMKPADIRAKFGAESAYNPNEQNEAYKDSYAYNTDSVTVFGTEFAVPGCITFYFDDAGYLSQLTFNFGWQEKSDSASLYPSAEAQKADCDKLCSLICAEHGAPSDTVKDVDGAGNPAFTWQAEDLSADPCAYWLTGGPDLWGIPGNTCNVLSFWLKDSKTEAIPFSSLLKAPEASSGESAVSRRSGSSKKSSSDLLRDGEYWCMGKGDTCKNKTYSPTDLYCHSCDPDDNNIEGDQRKKSSGEVKDYNGNGKVDENDWEKAWKKFLNEKMN